MEPETHGLLADCLEDYILDHIDPEPESLHRLYRFTHLNHLYPRMCSGHYQGRLLKMFTAMVNPSRVLEIGTFTGYSALAIAEGLTGAAIIDTIEIDAEKEPELSERFAASPYARQIRLHIGDALDVTKSLEGPYDMAFVDGNKRHYLQYLEAILPLMRHGGFILADNTLWDMKIVEQIKSNDPQTVAIAEFNDAVRHDARFEKVILPVRDGLTILRYVG